MDSQSNKIKFYFSALRHTLAGLLVHVGLTVTWKSQFWVIRRGLENPVRGNQGLNLPVHSRAFHKQYHKEAITPPAAEEWAHKEWWRLFSLFNYTKEGIQSYLKNRTPVKDRGTHENHSISWDGGRRSIVNIMRFKNNLAVWSHGNPVAISQGQSFIIIQNGIQIFNPDGINWTIKNYPDMFPWNATQEERREHTSTQVPM